MYTSGSTGNPKGVIITHRNGLKNIIQAAAAVKVTAGTDWSNQSYLAYLPMAHIMELSITILVLGFGVPVALSSPFTLTDKSPKIMDGQKGDLSLVKPTMLGSVPLIMDRVYKGIMLKVESRGPNFKKFFDRLCSYKETWARRGFDTPLANALVFNKLKVALGGNIKLLLVGGAPFSPKVQEFYRNFVCACINGYGLTESCGGFAIGDNDLPCGDVGYASYNSKVILESWEEGGYTVNDKVGPRGEILISGPGVTSSGYYKCTDEAANAAFFKDNDGVTWFRTGDIGQLIPSTGALRIIDRKKDLVKLQMGEYVSLSKVEAALNLHPAVELACIYADPNMTSTIAIVIPNSDGLKAFIKDAPDVESICLNKQVKAALLKDIQEHAKDKLEPFEIPRGIILTPGPWTPDSGLVTPSMKLRRNPIKQRFQEDIDQAYLEIEQARAKATIVKEN